MTISFLVTVGLLLGWAWSNREWLRSDIVKNGLTEAPVVAAVGQWRARRPLLRLPGAALFGDSMAECKDKGRGPVPLGYLVAQQLSSAGVPHDLVQVARGAFSPLQYYDLLDDVLAAAPDLIILQVDLGRLLTKDSPVRSLRYLSLSRKLSLARAWRIREALAFDGLSLFDPFIYRLEEKLDTLYVAPGVEEWSRHVLDQWGKSLVELLDLKTAPLDVRSWNLMRFDAARARDVFGVHDRRNPFVDVLREIVAELHRARVRVLLYVSPVNVDVLRRLGVLEELALAERIDGLRLAIGAAPTEWLDLHARVAGNLFQDWIGHMLPAGCELVSHEIVGALTSHQ